MNTIPSKYHSQIKKMIKKARETQKAEIIKMIEDKKQEHYWKGQDHTPPRALTNNEILDEVIEEIKKL